MVAPSGPELPAATTMSMSSCVTVKSSARGVRAVRARPGVAAPFALRATVVGVAVTDQVEVGLDLAVYAGAGQAERVVLVVGADERVAGTVRRSLVGAVGELAGRHGWVQ